MSKTLTEIAQQLKAANKKVQLIYAFNGMGKTRLSREFKQLIAPKADGHHDGTEVDHLCCAQQNFVLQRLYGRLVLLG